MIKKKFSLTITVDVISEVESDFDVVRKNLELLPNMASDFGLYVDGTSADVDKLSSKVKQVGKRGRPPKRGS